LGICVASLSHLYNCSRLDVMVLWDPPWPNSGIRAKVWQGFNWLLVSKVVLIKGVQAACPFECGNRGSCRSVWKSFCLGEHTHKERIDSHLRERFLLYQVWVICLISHKKVNLEHYKWEDFQCLIKNNG